MNKRLTGFKTGIFFSLSSNNATKLRLKLTAFVVRQNQLYSNSPCAATPARYLRINIGKDNLTHVRLDQLMGSIVDRSHDYLKGQ